MNPDGLTPFPIERWGGGVDWDSESQIPIGLAVVCKNCRFRADGVGTRYGSAHTMQFPGVGDITGLEVLQVLGDSAQQIPLVFSDTGMLLRETPPGSGTLVPVNPPILLPASAAMQTSKAYNNIYAAFSDLETPLIPPLVLNGLTGALNPISQNPIGSLWTPGRYAQIGDLVRSSIDPSRWFRCTAPGLMSETEPTWPTDYGHFTPLGPFYISATAQDQGGGRSQWEEWTPIATSELPAPIAPKLIAQNAGAGTIPANKDVYFKLSYVIPIGAITGESPVTGPIKFTNTAGNAQLALNFQSSGTQGGPNMPSWMAQIIQQTGRYIPFKLRVYVAAVATGAAAPVSNVYKWLGDFLVTNTIVCSAIPTLALPSTSGAAFITFASSFVALPHFQAPIGSPENPGSPAANVGERLAFIPPGFIGTAGARKMIVLRQDSQGSLSPVDPDSVISVSFDGPAQANIISIARVPDGTTTAVVSDISGFKVGATASVSSVLDPSFNGSVSPFFVGNAGFPSPQGTVAWHTGTLSQANSTGGKITGTAGPIPVAFVPPGGTNDSLDIAAFTVQGASAGGPFFFISDPDPAQIVQVSVVSITRASGTCTATLTDASAMSAGLGLAIDGATSDETFNGLVFLASVDGNTVTYPQPGADGTTTDAGMTATVVQELPTAVAPETGLLPGGLAAGIPLNFDDNFLANSNDVTDQLTAIPVPPALDAYFSPSLRKMVYTTGQDSNFLFSDTDDPANIQSPDGILSVEQNNGAKAVCFREMISGELLALKENGGYAITVGDSTPPSQWTPTRRWDGHGPCGPRAVALGPDFLIIFDENSGPYRYYQGSLSQIGHEKQGTWDRINKSAKKYIWVEVDDDLKEVRIGLPLDDATTPNKELVLNYFNGWDEPVIINYAGEEIPNRYGRRWSEDDRLSPIGRRLKRTLALPVDQRIDHRQMLYGMDNPKVTEDEITAETILLDASSNPQPVLPFGDYYLQAAKVINGVEVAYSRVLGPFQLTQVMVSGLPFWQVVQVNLPGDSQEDSWNIYFTNGSPQSFNQVSSPEGDVTEFILQVPGFPTTGPVGTMFVDMTVPQRFNDSGAGIDHRYRPAFFFKPTLEILQWEMMKGRAVGAGLLLIQPTIDDDSEEVKQVNVDLGRAGDPPVKFARGFGTIFNELYSVEFSNGAVPDSFFEMHSAVIYGRVKAPARKG